MTAYRDLINTGALRQTVDGIEETIEILISDVGGSTEARRYNALQDPAVPRMGSPHPAIPGLAVTGLEVLPVQDSPRSWLVRVTWGSTTSEQALDRDQPYGPATWRVSARTITQETNKDVHGERMRVYYSGYPILELLLLNTGEVNTERFGSFIRAARTHVANVDRPVLFLEASRWERDNPESRLASFHGCVNAEPWRGYPAHTALLLDVGAEQDPAGGWRVTYGFSVNRETWRIQAAIEMYGQTPQDATEGNGLATYEVYKPVAFSTLGLQ